MTVALSAAINTSTASAQSPPRITMVDFAVDWEKYKGKWIIVTGGVVNFASTEGAMLFTSGVSIPVQGPYQDKEDLRFLLNNCSGVEINNPASQCSMEVFGRVDTLPYSDQPALFNPDFPIQHTD